MTEKQHQKPEDIRGYRPLHEKLIPAAVITLALIAVGMLILAGAIALGLVGGA